MIILARKGKVVSKPKPEGFDNCGIKDKISMKGKKNYFLAEKISAKLYEYPVTLSAEELNSLYESYFALLRKGAYLGNVESQYDFAQQFENMSFLGLENPKHNPKKCVFWYSKACDNNHAEACNNLALLYETGKGCVKNLKTALDLYKKSSELGSPNGKKNYKIMQKDLAEGGKYDFKSNTSDY